MEKHELNKLGVSFWMHRCQLIGNRVLAYWNLLTSSRLPGNSLIEISGSDGFQYKGSFPEKGYVLDFLVGNETIIEIKAVNSYIPFTWRRL